MFWIDTRDDDRARPRHRKDQPGCSSESEHNPQFASWHRAKTAVSQLRNRFLYRQDRYLQDTCVNNSLSTRMGAMAVNGRWGR